MKQEMVQSEQVVQSKPKKLFHQAVVQLQFRYPVSMKSRSLMFYVMLMFEYFIKITLGFCETISVRLETPEGEYVYDRKHQKNEALAVIKEQEERGQAHE
jgi:hypothetical protein